MATAAATSRHYFSWNRFFRAFLLFFLWENCGRLGKESVFFFANIAKRHSPDIEEKYVMWGDRGVGRDEETCFLRQKIQEKERNGGGGGKKWRKKIQGCEGGS